MSLVKSIRRLCYITVALLPAIQPYALQAQSPIVVSSGSVVTFLSHRSEGNILYTARPDGTDVRPIFGGPIEGLPSFTDGVTLVREPHWTRQSPNGKYFASWVYEKGQPYSKYQGVLRPMLWVGDLEGKWTRIVNPDCGEEFAWSPDSAKIAFSILSSDHNQSFFQPKVQCTQICMSGIDGSNLDFVLEQKGIWSVQDWSPDGHRVLLLHREFNSGLKESTSELYEFQLTEVLDARAKVEVGNLPGTEWGAKTATEYLKRMQHALTGLVVHDTRYSPDGKSLALLAYDPQNMFAPNRVADDEPGRGRMMRLLCKLATLELSSGRSAIIADYDDGIRGPICWSHGGTEILFSRYLPKEDDREKTRVDNEHGLAIWAIGRDGKKARFLSTGLSPDCSRDINR